MARTERDPARCYRLRADEQGNWATARCLTDTLGVAAAVASPVVIIPKIADVLLDPWIGVISDRMMGRNG